ncbi:MAG: mechanosensitive ion channel family protein [Bacteroidales bacterium]
MGDYLDSFLNGEYYVVAYLISSIVVFLILLTVLLVLNRSINSWIRTEDYELLSLLRRKIRLPVVLLLVFLSFVIPASFFNQEISPLEPFGNLMSIMVIIFVSWILIQAVYLIKHFVLGKFDMTDADNLRARKIYTQFRVLENIILFLIIVVAMSLILMSFESIRKIGVSLIASAGVAGIIIGFAAQKAIGTILAGIQIALSQPIRLDDVVIVENEWGRIEEINLTYVVVAIWDKRRLVLPTTYFIEKPFQNWTRTTSEILGSVFIYADYTLPVNEVREELDRILEGNPLWDGQVKVVQVTDATEKTIEVRVLVSAADSSTAWDLRVHVREKLLSFLQDNYPQCLPKARLEMSSSNQSGI